VIKLVHFDNLWTLVVTEFSEHSHILRNILHLFGMIVTIQVKRIRLFQKSIHSLPDDFFFVLVDWVIIFLFILGFINALHVGLLDYTLSTFKSIELALLPRFRLLNRFLRTCNWRHTKRILLLPQSIYVDIQLISGLLDWARANLGLDVLLHLIFKCFLPEKSYQRFIVGQNFIKLPVQKLFSMI
jgi:hypothetical protein